MGSDIELSGSLSAYEVLGDKVYLRAGDQEVVISRITVVAAFKERARTALAVAGGAVIVLSLLFFIPYIIAVTTPMPPGANVFYVGFNPTMFLMLGLVTLVIGIALIIAAYIRSYEVVIETSTGTKVRVKAPPHLARGLVNELRRNFPPPTPVT